MSHPVASMCRQRSSTPAQVWAPMLVNRPKRMSVSSPLIGCARDPTILARVARSRHPRDAACLRAPHRPRLAPVAPRRAMAETADAVIIGGGIHGASLAFQLTRRGLTPVVVERRAVAAGATGGPPGPGGLPHHPAGGG